MGNKTEIALSKKKGILSLIGALLFVVAGSFATVMPEEFVSMIFRSSELIQITGLAAICFFWVMYNLYS